MRSGLSRRAVAVGGALLGLTAIVALASRAHGPGGGSTRTVSTDWLSEYLLLLVGVTFAAAVIAGIYLVVTAHQGGARSAKTLRGYSLGMMLSTQLKQRARGR